MAITERRLTAILAADVCDFSRMMGENEDRTIKNLRTCRELIESSISSHKGNIFNTAGDSIVAEFGSVVDAVNCAVSFQETLRDRNSSVPETSKMEFRVGINLGDIIIEEDNRYGDGINIAARLEGLSEPGGICISGSVYSDIKSKLNLEFGAMGEQVLKNIAQPVSAYKIDFGGDPPTPLASVGDLDSTPIAQPASVPEGAVASSSSQSDKPSIAVLPFDNMSNDPEQEYFTDGITEDIITALSHLRWLSVIARNSSFTYKGQSPDVRKVSEELNCRYVLEGSIQKAGKRVRINAQLLEGATGNHIWAEKYDRELENIFDLQDELTSTVVLKIRPELERIEFKRTQAKTQESMDAWDLFQKGKWSIYEGAGGVYGAIKWFKLAEKADDQFADATAMRINVEAVSNFLFNTSFDLQEGYNKLENMRIRDPNNDLILTGMGTALNYGLGRSAEALELFKGAIELNPTNMQAQRYHLMCLIWLGMAEEALDHFERIKAISPKDPEMLRMDTRRAEAYLCLEDFKEAKKYGEIAISHSLTIWPSYTVLISALGHLGELSGIDDILEKMRNRIESDPKIECAPEQIISTAYVQKVMPFSDNRFKKIYLSGLEKARFPK